MALIEGVGDEVTVLFSLIFILLVLVLSWASTHTIDRSDQAQQLADGSPVELEDPVCPFSTEASAQPAASETGTVGPGCTAESQRGGAEEEMESQRGGAEEEMESQRGGAEEEMESQRGSAEEEMESQRGSAEEEMESQRGSAEEEMESQRGSAEEEMESQRGSAEEEMESQRGGAEEEMESQRCGAEEEMESQRGGAEEEMESQRCGAEEEMESQRCGAEEEMESQRGGAEEEMESQRCGAEGEMESQRYGAEGEMESQQGGAEEEMESQRYGAEGEMESQQGGAEGEEQRDKEEQRSSSQGQRDRVEGERQEKKKRNDIEEQVVPEPEEAWPTVSATEDLVSDPVPLRQRLSARGRDAAETQAIGGHLPHSDCAQDSSMVMRLKFLNDTERIVQVRPEHTIGHIKRTQFPHQEHQVRLIYQGQLLGDDTQTLSSLHITGNCVVHCHISQNATPQSPAGSHAAENTDTTLNIGGLMLPLFLLMLSILWYYQINYRHFFTPPATISLVGITILFSFVAFGAYRR